MDTFKEKKTSAVFISMYVLIDKRGENKNI